MAMFNIKTLLSTFDKKGTLMKWLKELTENATEKRIDGRIRRADKSDKGGFEIQL